MKKILIYLLIITIGTAGVYYGLTKYNHKKDDTKEEKETNVPKKEKEEIIPSKDAFVSSFF